MKEKYAKSPKLDNVLYNVISIQTTSDTETPSLTPETDPKLEWQYQLYQDYLYVAEQICNGIDMMQEGRDEDALKFLIFAKEQAAKWKESLWRGSSNNNIDSLMTGSSLFLTIQKLGKHVLTVGIFFFHIPRPIF